MTTPWRLRGSYNSLAIGDLVTCKIAIPARYSNYGVNPYQMFRPGMVATVTSVRVPKVRIVRTGPQHDGRDEFVNADFVGDNGKVWGVSLNYCNIVRV